ncbi:MAG: xylulokinase [Clostridiales bacterium]|nr:xylulokinase [Clostridiales bacterium]
MRYTIGCDFGGGASKATLLREDGVIAATATCEYPTSYPKPGWAEQDPDDSLRAFVQNVRELLSHVDPSDVVCVALDGATHTAVLLDEHDRVIRPAIYWTDRRSVREAEELKSRTDLDLRKRTYNAPSALWTLPQLMWLKSHEPENFAKIRRVLSMKDYVRYRLTGDYVTDEIEAMGFLLLDARTNTWDAELCALCGLSPAMMPKIVPPTEVLSQISSEMCTLTGLSPDTKVIAGSTDTVMEVYASGAIAVGQATVKLATAGRICPITDRAYVDPLLVTYRHVVPGLWYPGTATKSCAASYRWFRDTFGQSLDYPALDELAAQVSAGCEGMFFHPYLQGEITPYLDDSLRASFTGVTSRHGYAHFTRAVLEGVGYSMKSSLSVLRGLGMDIRQASVIGGGAKSALWRQILADMLGIPLQKNVCDDSSFGSAMLAGVASGVFHSFSESVDVCVRPAFTVEPDAANVKLYEDRFPDYLRIHDALAPIYNSYVY